MKMKKAYLALAIISSVLVTNSMAMAKNNEDLKDGFNPEEIKIIQLEPSTVLNSEGGIAAFASTGAWTDVIINPNITIAGSWILGPLMLAPSGTPSTSIVQNITFQWNIWNYRSDLITYLCESTLNQCIDVSGDFGAGASIQQANIPANRAWRYVFGIPGSGSVNPVLYGQNGSIAVTFQ